MTVHTPTVNAPEPAGPLSRGIAVRTLVESLGARDRVVSPLGYLSREVYAYTGSQKEKCLYCMGSMGSVIPLALGVALACPRRRVFALEGDGSLLMNLGTLYTVSRYGPGNLRIVIFDNGVYESSGAQQSQPAGCRLERACRAAGLPTAVATNAQDLGRALRWLRRARKPAVIVAKVATSPPQPRIADAPSLIARRFARHLRGKAAARA